MKSALVTGATGFFGRAFIRRALEIGATRVCVYSRDEWKQAQMRTEFGNDDRLRWFIGDVRDKDRLRRAMEGCETVVHAAALKRVEVGQYCPDEMLKTNVLGAQNVIDAAREACVQNVVALSTDKAADPYNTYGVSKLMAERLFLNANNMQQAHGPRFSVTRYGNVSGSTGSVIPIWRKLLSEGKRLPVTDQDCTRFWMSVDQAVELVLWSIGRELLVVPELPAYRVGDLVEAMGGEPEIVGMGNGEKKHETMTSEQEVHEFVKLGPYWVKGQGTWMLPASLTSDTARRMTVDELKENLRNV